MIRSMFVLVLVAMIYCLISNGALAADDKEKLNTSGTGRAAKDKGDKLLTSSEKLDSMFTVKLLAEFQAQKMTARTKDGKELDKAGFEKFTADAVGVKEWSITCGDSPHIRVYAEGSDLGIHYDKPAPITMDKVFTNLRMTAKGSKEAANITRISDLLKKKGTAAMTAPLSKNSPIEVTSKDGDNKKGGISSGGKAPTEKTEK